MDKFKAWLASHKISAHTIAAAAVTLTGLYARDEAFRNYVNGLYADTPSWLHKLIAGAIIPIFTYYRSQK